MYQVSIFHRRGTRRIFRSCQKKKSFSHGEEHRPRVPRPELRAALAALRHGPLAVLPVQGAARRTGRGRGQHCQGTGLAERARRHAGHSLPPRPSWPPGPARPPAWKGPSRPRAWGQRGARRALSGDTAREVHPPRRAGHAGLLPGRAAPPPVQRMCCQRGRELGETAAPPLPARGPRRTITSTLCPGGHRPPSTRGFLFGTQAWETHRVAERNE